MSERMTDAAMADAIKRACQYYKQAGRVASTSQMLAKQHESTADKIIAAALRARPQAVGEGAVVMPKEVPNAIRKLIEDAVAYETDNEISQSGITDLWFDIRNQLAMLAASQSATGGA